MSITGFWSISDIRQGLVAAVVLALETANAHGAVNVDFVAGVLAMARSRALACGIPWSFVVNDARAALADDLRCLLDQGLVVQHISKPI